MAKKRNWESLSPAYQARLKRGGITKTSYNKGADLSAARGHAKPGTVSKPKPKSKKKSDLTIKGRNLQVLKGNKFRDISIPIHYKRSGVADMDRAYREWSSIISGLHANPRVFASNTLLYYEHNDMIQAYPVTPAEKLPTVENLKSGIDKVVDKYLVKLIGDLKLINLTVHVIFKAKYLKSKK